MRDRNGGAEGGGGVGPIENYYYETICIAKFIYCVHLQRIFINYTYSSKLGLIK